MAFQTFIIPAKLDSWNSLIGKHFRSVEKIKNYWKMLTIQALSEYKIKPVTSFPCEISVHCKFKNRTKRDIDSLYVKALVDQLVTSGILPDDNLEYVDKVSFGGEIGSKNDEIIVVITSS